MPLAILLLTLLGSALSGPPAGAHLCAPPLCGHVLSTCDSGTWWAPGSSRDGGELSPRGLVLLCSGNVPQRAQGLAPPVEPWVFLRKAAGPAIKAERSRSRGHEALSPTCQLFLP